MLGAARILAATAVSGLLCAGGAASVAAQEPLKLADTLLEPASWRDLAGWPGDDHLAAFAPAIQPVVFRVFGAYSVYTG